MNWFAENKIFSSLLAIIVMGILGLGYLTFAESGKYTEAVTAYQSGMDKLTELRSRVPFRNADNFKKKQEQVASYKQLTDSLHADLIQKQGTITAIDPSAFQGRLRESVSKTIEHANQRGVKLPPKFYLGFETYENQLPRNDITGLLSWQLTAVEAVVNRLIDLKVTEITQPIFRSPLPGELNPEPPSKEVPLLKKYPFVITFLGYPSNVQSILNDLVSLPQFTIARAVRIENEQLKGPLRAGAGAATGDSGAATTAAAPAIDTIIIGKEKVTTSIIIDLVQFTTKQPPKK